MSFDYLTVILFLFLIALSLKIKYKIKLFRNLKEVVFYFGIVLIIGIIWDHFALYRGDWIYSGKGILGIYIGLMPIEDYLFALSSTFDVLVLYKVLQKL